MRDVSGRSLASASESNESFWRRYTSRLSSPFEPRKPTTQPSFAWSPRCKVAWSDYNRTLLHKTTEVTIDRHDQGNRYARFLDDFGRLPICRVQRRLGAFSPGTRKIAVTADRRGTTNWYQLVACDVAEPGECCVTRRETVGGRGKSATPGAIRSFVRGVTGCSIGATRLRQG